MSLSTDNLFAIGDIQGCYESLLGLLDQLPGKASLIFLGDLVNRGPQSLQTLRLVKSLCEEKQARTVLGNHDLHLLALAAAGKSSPKKDTLDDILKADDREELLDWLRKRPLLIETDSTVFVHAGIPPQWTLQKARALAEEVHAILSGDDWKSALLHMYGADVFSDALTGDARLRGILNALTRMRFLMPDGTPDFSIKEGIAKMPPGYIPWFEAPRLIEKPICFGHWSMLGLVLRPNTLAVDTGCLWGGALSALRISDKRLFQEPCPCWSQPGC